MKRREVIFLVAVALGAAVFLGRLWVLGTPEGRGGAMAGGEARAGGPGMPEGILQGRPVDLERLRRKMEAGELSDREAKFYRSEGKP